MKNWVRTFRFYWPIGSALPPPGLGGSRAPARPRARARTSRCAAHHPEPWRTPNPGAPRTLAHPEPWRTPNPGAPRTLAHLCTGAFVHWCGGAGVRGCGDAGFPGFSGPGIARVGSNPYRLPSFLLLTVLPASCCLYVSPKEPICCSATRRVTPSPASHRDTGKTVSGKTVSLLQSLAPFTHRSPCHALPP
jgi:hypothetical protein